MDRLRNFAENTTIHGIKDFLRIDYMWARCLWAIFVLSCFGMMIFEMSMLLTEYIEDPTATQVRQKYLAQYPYPKMIFCPKEWINESKVMEMNIPRPMLIYGLSLLKRIRLKPNDTQPLASNITQLDREFRDFLKSRNVSNYLDFYLQIADDYSMVSQCDQCDTHTNQILASGVCIQWRASPATSDLLIQLPPRFRYTEVKPTISQTGLVPDYIGSFASDAMYVSFRPQYDFFAYDPILLNRNNSYVFRIKPTNYIRLNKPLSQCVEEAKAKQESYSQLMCYFRCDESYKDQCQHCRLLSIDSNKNLTYSARPKSNATIPKGNSTTTTSKAKLDTNLPYCSSIIFDPVLNQNCAETNETEFVKCARLCHPLCTEWVYETTVIPVAQRNLITVNPGADITCVLSYQVRFGETFIEEVQTYSWETFISNIGGQLGLWMGASVVSLLQLFHFLAEVFYYDWNPCKRTKTVEGDHRSNTNQTLASTVFAVSLGAQNWSFRSAFQVEDRAETERSHTELNGVR